MLIRCQETAHVFLFGGTTCIFTTSRSSVPCPGLSGNHDMAIQLDIPTFLPLQDTSLTIDTKGNLSNASFDVSFVSFVCYSQARLTPRWQTLRAPLWWFLPWSQFQRFCTRVPFNQRRESLTSDIHMRSNICFLVTPSYFVALSHTMWCPIVS